MPIFSGTSSIWDQAFNPKTYVDGYGVEREEYVSPIAKALRIADKFLNKPNTVIGPNGEEMKTITGTPPMANLAFSPIILAKRIKLLNEISKAEKATRQVEANASGLSRLLRLPISSADRAKIRAAQIEEKNLRNIFEHTYGTTGLAKGREEFEKIKQAKVGGVKVGKALRENPFGPAGIYDLKESESPYLRRISEAALKSYGEAKNAGSTVNEAKAIAGKNLTDDLLEMYNWNAK